MPTNDERREVAARLRSCARETNGTGDLSTYLRHWINADGKQEGNPFTVQADRKSAERTLEKLADLIDPTDETCEAELTDTVRTRGIIEVYECSKCGKSWERVWSDDFAYCPYCGRLIENADE